MNLTDGQSHQVALYSLDWDGQSRAQTIEVLDASTGTVLDTRAVSNFAGGVYHVWEVSGHVLFRVTKTGGPNAVVSGLFFDTTNPLPMVTIAPSDPSASEAGQDPGEFTVSRSGDPSAALTVQYTVGGTASNGDYSETLGGTVTIPAGQSSVTIPVTPEDDPEDEPDETVILTLVGDLSYKIGSSNTATVTIADNDAASGSPVSFVGLDSTTQGSWQGVYGADGGRVSQDGVNDPAYAAVSIQQALNFTWTPSTTDVRAPERLGSSERLAGTWYSGGSFTIDVNLTDGQSHQVAVYSLDWDGQSREQTIEVLDASTGAVLDTRAVSNFTGGVYHVWEVSGHVQFRITKTAGPNAVVSGLFFDSPVAAAAGGGGTAFLSILTPVMAGDEPEDPALEAAGEESRQEADAGFAESSASVVPVKTDTSGSTPTPEPEETTATDRAMVELALDFPDEGVLDQLAEALEDPLLLP